MNFYDLSVTSATGEEISMKDYEYNCYFIIISNKMRKFRKKHETIANDSETQQNLNEETLSATSKTDFTQEEIDELKKTAKRISVKLGSSLDKDFQSLLSASKK